MEYKLQEKGIKTSFDEHRNLLTVTIVSDLATLNTFVYRRLGDEKGFSICLLSSTG